MRPVTIQIIISFVAILFLTNCTKENNLLETPESPVTTETTTTTTKGKNSNNPALADFQAYIKEEMEDQHIPAMSVLIFEGDEVLYEGCFGKTHLQKNIPLENNHLFLLASVSKVVTGTALLQLHEQGEFDLDDPINDYLDFNVAIPNQSKAITFRMLLTHTSGIADGAALDDQYYYGKDSPVALGEFLEDYLTPSGDYYDRNDNFHNFRPGTKSEYSNIGSALIGHLVAEISGMDFSDYCEKNIFNPLGMSNTAWHLADISQTIVQPYDYVNGRNEMVEHYTFTDYPNGGLRSTANDMFRLLTAFVENGKSNDYQLLKPNTVQQMLTAQIPNISEDTGLHIFLMDEQEQLWGHDGGESGVATTAAFNQKTKIGAIILSNQGEADLEELLVEAYLVGLNW